MLNFIQLNYIDLNMILLPLFLMVFTSLNNQKMKILIFSRLLSEGLLIYFKVTLIAFSFLEKKIG